MTVAFVTHYCTHYRVKTYETLARYVDVDYYFYSQGDEWYWLQQHGVRRGDFRYEYLPGFNLSRTRVSPTLPFKLLQKDYDAYIKCINGKFALPLTYAAARLKNKPFILWTGIWMRLRTPAHRLLLPVTRYLYTHADAVVVYGDHVRRYLLDEGVQDRRIFVTKHAVDNDLYSRPIPAIETQRLCRELNIASDQKVVLYLGRLVAEKGVSFLIEAFAELNRDDAVLVIVGAGPERERLVRQTKTEGVEEKVRFVGYVEPEKAVSYYALAYVYVLPSVTTKLFKEPWGLVVNEAFNQGIPVIATDAVGAAAGGLVRDGWNGFVVPERDSEALAQKMAFLLDHPSERDVLSDNARRAIKHWGNEEMVVAFREAVRHVLADRD